MTEKEINGKMFRFVTIRNRSKWISKDGCAYNPIRMNQKATIHYNHDGYPCFGGGVPVHLYVANGWVDGKKDGYEVDHIDYDRNNFNADNLRWVTHIDNVHNSSFNTDHYSKSKSGEINGRATMTNDFVDHIKDMFSRGMKTSEVIRAVNPDLDTADVKRLWNKYNRIKTEETWSA